MLVCDTRTAVCRHRITFGLRSQNLRHNRNQTQLEWGGGGHDILKRSTRTGRNGVKRFQTHNDVVLWGVWIHYIDQGGQTFCNLLVNSHIYKR